MAVTMSGEFVLPADKATVWARLNDAETLKASIPGCESLEKLSDTEMQAVVKVKIGPVSARFKGKVNLTDIDAPNSYRISGQGDGGIAGFAKGGANVRLSDADGGGTRLGYDVDAQVGGKIAQLGSRLIDSTAKKLAERVLRQLRHRAGRQHLGVIPALVAGIQRSTNAEASQSWIPVSR